jgi:hypothetical protein
MKKILAALLALAALGAQATPLVVGNTYQDASAATWTYIGDYDVGSGPLWYAASTPANYSALDAAALVFGVLDAGQKYAISTVDGTVNHMAWYDGYGNGAYLPLTNSYGSGGSLAENFFIDVGAFGYTGMGDFSAYVGGDRATFGGGAFNHVFVSATHVPEPDSIALFGLGLAGFAFARRKSAK